MSLTPRPQPVPPSAPSGYTISRFNARQHGYSGKNPILDEQGTNELSRILEGFLDDYKPSTTVDFVLCEDAANAVYQMNAIKAEIARIIAAQGIESPALKNIYAYLNVQRLAFTRSIRILDARRLLGARENKFAAKRQVEAFVDSLRAETELLAAHCRAEREAKQEKNETDSVPEPPAAEIFNTTQPFAVDPPSSRPFNFTQRNG